MQDSVVISQSFLDAETVDELLRFVPFPLIRSKRPFKGYTSSRVNNCISSNLTAGEYYPIEPAVLKDCFWSQSLELISANFDLKLSTLSGIRCQLNCIPINAKYHPLSISPHADSISNEVDVVAINIPLTSARAFRTAFWSHKAWGNALDLNEYMRVHSQQNTIPYSSPFAAADLLLVLDDNPQFTTTDKLKLRDWTLESVVETELGSLCAYNGSLFHSPYLDCNEAMSGISIESLTDLRVSLAIFVVFKRENDNRHSTSVNDDWLSSKLLRHRVKTSLTQLDGTCSTYTL